MPNHANAPLNKFNELPLLLRQVEGSCVERIEKLLIEFFSRCDDSLFEFAETATSNRDQSLYFEAMRELRMRKADIGKQYLAALTQGFSELAGPRRQKPALPDRELPQNHDELELLNNEELEESVAISKIVNRSRMTHAESLLQFVARLEHVLGGRKIDDDANPIDPAKLLNLFSQCTETLDIEINLKVFLYRRFDQVVISQLGDIYHSANELLIVGGILPKLKLKTKTAANDARTATRAGKIHSEEEDLNSDSDNDQDREFNVGSDNTDPNLQELRTLLAEISTGITSLPGTVDFSQFAGGTVMNSNVLSNLLHIDATAPANEDQISGNSDFGLNQIPLLVNNLLRQQRLAGKASGLRAADEHTINLVSLFFDFVLDAENLPIDMQALLARLQIPVLKIALRDQYLFTTKDHPLRELINQMAQASYGRDVERQEDQAFFTLSNKLVQGLISDPELTEADFINLIADLQEFLDSEDMKSQELENRVSQSARNSALARHAREKLAVVLKEKFKQRLTPTPVAEFVYQDWHNIMLACYLNHGEQSANWRTAEQLVDDLLWSSQLHNDQRSKQRLERLRDSLYQTIEIGMSSHRQAPADWPDRLQQIKNMHDVILTSDKKGYQRLLPQDKSLTNSEQSPSWENTPVLPSPEFKHLQRVQQLKPGDWIRLSLPGSENEKYCKVSAYLETDESFLLVSRFGARVAILDCHALAHSLQNGTLKIVEDTPLFDQAVANISAKLRGIRQN